MTNERGGGSRVGDGVGGFNNSGVAPATPPVYYVRRNARGHWVQAANRREAGAVFRLQRGRWVIDTDLDAPGAARYRRRGRFQAAELVPEEDD